jgi:hypothetical protein
LAKSSTKLFQNFNDQYYEWGTIKLPRNGAKRKCKLLKSCQVNASTKTGCKGCAGECLETARKSLTLNVSTISTGCFQMTKVLSVNDRAKVWEIKNIDERFVISHQHKKVRL